VEGLTAKDLLDRVSSAADLGVVLTSGSVAFGADEVWNFSPAPSGTTAIVAIGLALGLKKMAESGYSRARRGKRERVEVRHVRARASAAREAYVRSGRFDLAEQLTTDLELEARNVLPTTELAESVDTTLAKFRSEKEQNAKALEEWREIQRAAVRANGSLTAQGGPDRLLDLLRESQISVDEVRDALRTWMR
jgi:hypothetical protein